MNTKRIAPGIYSLSVNGIDYWVEGINGDGLWLVHDQTAGEYWFNWFRTKRAAISAIIDYSLRD